MSKFEDYSPAKVPTRSTLDVTIRSGCIDDVDDLAAIAAEREGESIDRWQVLFTRLLDACASGMELLLVALVDDTVVGYGRVSHYTPPADAPANTAPEGWYLTGVVVDQAFRRRGVGLALTRARIRWIAERSTTSYYFANAMNQSSIDLHGHVGFVEVTRDFWFPGVAFMGGTGILFRCDHRL